MSDARLRALERAAAAGDPAARAAALAARVRTGAVSLERLRLAAAFEHEAARAALALPDVRDLVEPHVREALDWRVGTHEPDRLLFATVLPPCGKEAAVRVAAAAARRLGGLEGVVAAAHAWLAAPGISRLDELRAAVVDGALDADEHFSPRASAARQLMHAATAVARDPPVEVELSRRLPDGRVVSALVRKTAEVLAAYAAADAVWAVAREVGLPVTLEAIRDEVGEWAVG